MRCFIILLFLISGSAHAHQFTPTYPEIRGSYVANVYKVDMKLFNKRKEISYYEIEAFDKDWQPLPIGFNSIIQIDYLETKDVPVYLAKNAAKRVLYVCSKSKILKGQANKTLLSSKICSKIKNNEQ